MYIKCRCPSCKEQAYTNLRLLIVEEIQNRNKNYLLGDVEVRDTVTEEQLVRDVLRELMGHIYNGITVSEICKILKDNFGILSRYCCNYTAA